MNDLMANLAITDVSFSATAFSLQWEADCGFGRFTFHRGKSGGFVCDDECMGKENVGQVLALFLEQCRMASSGDEVLVTLNGRPMTKPDLEKEF